MANLTFLFSLGSGESSGIENRKTNRFFQNSHFLITSFELIDDPLEPLKYYSPFPNSFRYISNPATRLIAVERTDVPPGSLKPDSPSYPLNSSHL